MQRRGSVFVVDLDFTQGVSQAVNEFRTEVNCWCTWKASRRVTSLGRGSCSDKVQSSPNNIHHSIHHRIAVLMTDLTEKRRNPLATVID